MTVHDLRKQSVNLLSPVKQLRRGTITNSGRSLGEGSSDIIRLDNPEKRLSIRPLMTTAPPLPTFTEGSEHSEPRKRIFSNVELEAYSSLELILLSRARAAEHAGKYTARYSQNCVFISKYVEFMQKYVCPDRTIFLPRKGRSGPIAD